MTRPSTPASGPRSTFAGRTVSVNSELFDLVDDPGERRDLAKTHPEVVAELRARLVAALARAPAAGSSAATASSGADDARPPTLHLRFVGGGRARRVSGSIVIGDAKAKARTFSIEPVDLGRDSLKITGDRAEIALMTSSAAAAGFDIVVDPATTPVIWDLYLDDTAWPEEGVFGGPYGLLTPLLRTGMRTEEARVAAQSTLLPPIDPRRDSGLFVIRERRGEATETRDDNDEGAEEMTRLLREWGYAHGPSPAKEPTR